MNTTTKTPWETELETARAEALAAGRLTCTCYCGQCVACIDHTIVRLAEVTDEARARDEAAGEDRWGYPTP